MKRNKKRRSIVLFKSLSVQWKLIVGFGVVFLILLASIGMSAWSISGIGGQVEAYSHYTYPLGKYNLAAQRDMVSTQRYMMMAIENKGRGVDYENYISLAQESAASFAANFDAFASNQRSNANDEAITQVREYMAQAATIREQILEFLSRGQTVTSYAAFEHEYLPVFNQISEIMEAFLAADTEQEIVQRQNAEQIVSLAWTMLIAFAAISLLIIIAVISGISKAILIPVREIEAVYGEMAQGNLHTSVSYQSRDELGRMAQSIRTTNALLVSYIEDITEKLTLLSRGDMRIEVDLDYVGDFAPIKQSMIHTASALNRTMGIIGAAAEQVNSGAGQVSCGAQALASGAAEQAATVEELNASVSAVTQQAEQNAVSVKRASDYVAQAGNGIGESNNYMQKLNTAMKEIGGASEKISHITKVIEDIAFQTNILALNAAVESARAGSAGKGFAVVADEVRNLAAKSAQAAKQTADLIEYSVKSVAEGEKLAGETTRTLQNVAEKARLVEEAIGEIAAASADQTYAIEQINSGISQVSAVVQTNAATAEESSASSEELAAQAQTLQAEVSKFRLASSEITTHSVPTLSVAQEEKPPATAGMAVKY